MNSLIRAASLMIFAVLFAPVAGCVTFFPLDPYLDKAIGQRTGDVRYPQLRHQKLVRDEGSRAVFQYSIDALWRCRWEFEVEKGSDVIKSWRYPDEDAAKYCSALPSSRP
jgi:hypothetical protein